jgi:type I restriction enzyme S subunit
LLEQFRRSVLAAAFRGDLTADWRAAHPNVEPASELLHRIRAERRRRWEQAELAKYKAKGQKPPKNWQDKYEKPEPVDNSNLSELPTNWQWVNVDEISIKVTDGVHKKPNYVESGIPFLTVKNLTAGTGISFDDTRFVTESDHKEFIKRTHPEKGDILVTKDGTLGVIRMIESKQVFSIFVSLALIKPVFQHMSPFIVSMLQSPQGQAGMKATGSGLQHIHLVDLRATIIPLPPAAEQQVMVERIEERFEEIGVILDETMKCLKDLDLLDQSILAKAFRGELVPQDPGDEPAAAPLERIREQRAQQVEATKGNRKASRTQRRNQMGKKLSGLTSQRRRLTEVLTTKGQPMTPEQLLAESGYDDDSIEEFYLALRKEVAKGRIRENRPTEIDVILEAIKP